MHKKRSVFLSLLLVIFESFSESSLDGTRSSFGLPYASFVNPALSSTQLGFPYGLQLALDPATAEMSVSNGLILTNVNKAVNFFHKANLSNHVHTLAAGYSQTYDFVGYGVLGKFTILDQNVSFSLDGGVAYHVNKERDIYLTIKNIFVTDTQFSNAGYECLLGINGAVPFTDEVLFGEIHGSVSTSNDIKKVEQTSGTAMIRLFPLKNKHIILNSGIEIIGDHKEKKNELIISAGLGTIVHFFDFGIGFFAGTDFNSTSGSSALNASLYLNPTDNKDIYPPEAKLTAMANEKSAYLSMQILDEESGVKEWSVIIADGIERSSAIIKTFSGGNIPPSTILWDYHDSRGLIREEKIFYARLIAVDTKKNVSKTAWIKIERQ